MVKVTECCSLETVIVDSRTPVKFEIDIKKFPAHKALLGKVIGDKFHKGDISKLVKDKEVCYEIINIIPHLSEKEILRIRYNEKVSELIGVLKSYGFEGFIHTTELSNFESILKIGKLVPRNYLLDKNITFTDKANQDIIQRTKDFVKLCCRFYYAYKTPTNHSAYYDKPISLVFDETLAYYPKNAYFASRNACFGSYTNEIDSALQFDWEGVFERGSHSLSKYFKPDCSEDFASLKKRINAIRNAEFLFFGTVPLSFIKKIVVYNKSVYEELRMLCDDGLFCKVVLMEGEL